MAKLATQTIAIQISKAVANSAKDEITLLDSETISQLQEAVEALVNDDSAVVELIDG